MAGLDIGTSRCKLTVYEDTGAYLGYVHRSYPAASTQSEQKIDAIVIWQAVYAVLSEAAEKFPGIGSIGVTSFGETFVLLGKENEPLCLAMLYTNPRGEEECCELIRTLGAQRINEITGVKPHHMYSLPKLMWVKRHCPEIYARICHVCLIEDYIVYLLTGRRQIDYSLATRTMGFDIHNLAWSSEIFAAAGISPEFFSIPVPTGTDAGALLPELARKTGLSEETHIVSVSHDQVAAAIGSGVFDEKCAVDGAGTVECITPVFSQADTAVMAQGNYNVVPYVMPGTYVCYAFSYTGGALIKWFVENLAGYAAQQAAQSGTSIYQILESGFRDRPTGLLVLPHFAGAATPYMDAGSKGAIIGLTIANTQQDIYLALMEGVCYEMRLNMEFLRKAGIAICALRATGGGANSRVWLQMKADILNVPVTALRCGEAGAAGSAMLAGIAAGVFKDIREAASVMVTLQETYEPRAVVHERYEECYRQYQKLYGAVRPLVG